MTHSHPVTNVDLGKYVQPRRVLAGPEWGMEVRAAIGLDRLDEESGTVVIDIPEYVISLNSSFLRGLIRPSIMHLGLTEFAEKYRFTGPDFSNEIQDEMRRTLIHIERKKALAAA